MVFASGHHELLEPSASGRSSAIWGASGRSSAIWGASRLPLLGLAGHPDFSEMLVGRL